METKAFYELRQYQAQPGKRNELVQFMEQVIIPFQISKGMVVTGSFVDEQNEDGFVWIRRFENETHREQTYAATYESDVWKTEILPIINGLLIREKIVVNRLIPTPGSALD
jgi:NIPSNAP